MGQSKQRRRIAKALAAIKRKRYGVQFSKTVAIDELQSGNTKRKMHNRHAIANVPTETDSSTSLLSTHVVPNDLEHRSTDTENKIVSNLHPAKAIESTDQVASNAMNTSVAKSADCDLEVISNLNTNTTIETTCQKSSNFVVVRVNKSGKLVPVKSYSSIVVTTKSAENSSANCADLITTSSNVPTNARESFSAIGEDLVNTSQNLAKISTESSVAIDPNSVNTPSHVQTKSTESSYVNFDNMSQNLPEKSDQSSLAIGANSVGTSSNLRTKSAESSGAFDANICNIFQNLPILSPEISIASGANSSCTSSELQTKSAENSSSAIDANASVLRQNLPSKPVESSNTVDFNLINTPSSVRTMFQVIRKENERLKTELSQQKAYSTNLFNDLCKFKCENFGLKKCVATLQEQRKDKSARLEDDSKNLQQKTLENKNLLRRLRDSQENFNNYSRTLREKLEKQTAELNLAKKKLNAVKFDVKLSKTGDSNTVYIRPLESTGPHHAYVKKSVPKKSSTDVSKNTLDRRAKTLYNVAGEISGSFDNGEMSATIQRFVKKYPDVACGEVKNRWKELNPYETANFIQCFGMSFNKFLKFKRYFKQRHDIDLFCLDHLARQEMQLRLEDMPGKTSEFLAQEMARNAEADAAVVSLLFL